jgi:hypothetical protein
MATFTPDAADDYSQVILEMPINVDSAIPSITWNDPADILAGTPLTSKQLNATADVPGTFTYSPSAGSVLGVGDNTLTVTFTPDDTIDYTAATKQVHINVRTIQVTSVTVNGDFIGINGASEDENGLVTLTTDGTSGFTAGNDIVVAGFTSTRTGYNGAWTIDSVSGNHVTYYDTNSNLPATSNNTQNAGYAISLNSASGLIGNQRSMVESIAYTFNMPVDLASGAVSLAAITSGINTSGPATLATNTPDVVLTSLDGGSVWVVTFKSNSNASVAGHSIANGVYTITLDSSDVTSAVYGWIMNTTRPTDTFYRLYGDVTGFAGGYARVNNSDSLQFSNAYLTSTGTTGYRPDFDYNGDGRINNSDDLQFSNYYLSVWSGFTPTI